MDVCQNQSFNLRTKRNIIVKRRRFLAIAIDLAKYVLTPKEREVKTTFIYHQIMYYAKCSKEIFTGRTMSLVKFAFNFYMTIPLGNTYFVYLEKDSLNVKEILLVLTTIVASFTYSKFPQVNP